MADGRRTVVGVRLSDDDCARLDAMRGDTPRAEIAYAIIKNAIGGIVPRAPDPEIPPTGPARAVTIISDERMPPGVAAVVAREHDGRAQVQMMAGIVADDPLTVVPAETFDDLAASLDDPPEPVPALARAAARSRALRQGKAPAAKKFPCCPHCPHIRGGVGHDQACGTCP